MCNSLDCCNGICCFTFGSNAALVSLSRPCPLSSPLVLGKAVCTALQETRSRNLSRWKTARLLQEVRLKRLLFFKYINFSGRFIVWLSNCGNVVWGQGKKGKKESNKNKQLDRDCLNQQNIPDGKKKITELQLKSNEQQRKSFSSQRKHLRNYKQLFRSNTGFSFLLHFALKSASLPSMAQSCKMMQTLSWEKSCRPTI